MRRGLECRGNLDIIHSFGIYVLWLASVKRTRSGLRLGVTIDQLIILKIYENELPESTELT